MKMSTQSSASAATFLAETEPENSGCPVHWVADLTTSQPTIAPPTEGRPDPKEVREFFELYREHTEMPEDEWRARVAEVAREVAETGTYTHTSDELTVGAKLAWRNNTKCIGKLYWRGLQVRDYRDKTTAAEIVEGCLEHGEFVHNGGRVKPTITIFAPDRPGQPAARVRNAQLIAYAGYRAEYGTYIGDPATVAITELAQDCGWEPENGPGRFDILPIVVEMPDGTMSAHPVPQELAHEVEIEHPDYPAVKELGLRWYGFPSISDNILSIGGIQYPLAPFTGWYLASELAARDFTDTYRYNLLPEIAEAFGLDTSDVRSLWKDRAMIEMTTAVLHSYDQAGIRMDDHHTAGRKFHQWTQAEACKGRIVEAEWKWMIPPISASASPVFHEAYPDIVKLPNLFRRGQI